jgi:hypothetical protein
MVLGIRSVGRGTDWHGNERILRAIASWFGRGMLFAGLTGTGQEYTSEMVLCPILWGINYHIFMPVRLDEISNSIVDNRLKFVPVYQKKFGTVYTYFF